LIRAVLAGQTLADELKKLALANRKVDVIQLIVSNSGIWFVETRPIVDKLFAIIIANG